MNTLAIALPILLKILYSFLIQLYF